MISGSQAPKDPKSSQSHLNCRIRHFAKFPASSESHMQNLITPFLEGAPSHRHCYSVCSGLPPPIRTGRRQVTQCMRHSANRECFFLTPQLPSSPEHLTRDACKRTDRVMTTKVTTELHGMHISQTRKNTVKHLSSSLQFSVMSVLHYSLVLAED